MAEVNVNDILGKGFKFSQSAEEIQTLVPAGTIGAYIGCADWGEVGVPKLITGGATEFQKLFGSESKNPEAVVDYGYQGALHHFRNSSVGYFTRIANELDPTSLAKAKVSLSTGDTNGKATGNVVHSSAFGIDTNAGGSLGLSFNTATPVPVSVAIPASLKPEIESKTFVSAVIASGNEIEISAIINGASAVTETITIALATYSDLDILQDALNTGLVGTALENIVEFVGGTIDGFIALTTVANDATGTNTSINIVSATGGFATIFNTGLQAGSNVSKATITTAINLAVNTALGTSNLIYARFTSGDLLEVTNVSKRGSDSTVSITGSTIATILFGTATVVAGSAGTVIAELEAKYAGRLGNTITVDTIGSVADGNRFDIYFDGSLLGSIVNFSYDPSQANHIGKLINNDIFLQPYVTYNQVTSNYALEFPDGFTFLATGGRSGGLNVFPSGSPFDAEDESYPSENYVRSKIAEYSNIDVYDIDYICYPGGGASYGLRETTQDEIDKVCTDRQDCFGIIDPPFVSSVSEVVNWSNGAGGFSRTTALNSYFLVTAFPWIKVRMRDQIVNVPPSIRLGGTIANADRIAGIKFSAPAGTTRGVMRNVEGLTVGLTKDERDRLYADVYNGRINPISFNAGVGFYFDGNKTCLSENTSLRRINTMRVGLYIKKQIQAIVNNYFYQPSDQKTWESFTKDARAIMTILEEQRAIEPESDPDNGWKVICDGSINTPDITNKNGMVAKLEYVGIKSIERIAVFSNIREKRVTIQVV